MERQVDALVSDPSWDAIRFKGLPPSRTREDLAYQRMFVDHLGGIRAGQVLGRFATP